MRFSRPSDRASRSHPAASHITSARALAPNWFTLLASILCPYMFYVRLFVVVATSPPPPALWRTRAVHSNLIKASIFHLIDLTYLQFFGVYDLRPHQIIFRILVVCAGVFREGGRPSNAASNSRRPRFNAGAHAERCSYVCHASAMAPAAVAAAATTTTTNGINWLANCSLRIHVAATHRN